MAEKKALKRFKGVYVTESKVRKWRNKPDRCYWVAFREATSGQLQWERCGWASDGWTPESSQRKRIELLEQDRVGKYKPKKARKREAVTFGEFMAKRYLPWTLDNQKYPRKDHERYQKWLKPRFEKTPLPHVTPLDLERLKRDMKKEGMSDATVRHVLSIIRQAFNKAIQWGLWDGTNPCQRVKFPSPNNARTRFLSRDEAEQVLEALRKKNTMLAQIATISLYGGLRLGEVFGLTWGDVDMDNGIIHIRDTKNMDSRPVFITDPISHILDELTPGLPEEYLFTKRNGDRIVWLSKLFKEVVDESGLNDGIKDPRQKVTFHTLRHTYASWAVMAGIPLYTVGKALGHKTTTMTQRYSHLAPESQRAAFEAVEKMGRASDVQGSRTNAEEMQSGQG